MALKKLYADLSKVEEQDDGTIKVWGYASTAAVDSDGETVTADAMKAALPGYMKWGAVREMHQAKAAGSAIEAEVQDDGRTWFGAHVVDSEAVKKVKAGVYKGFSIGGKVTSRDEMAKTTITGINLVEVSLVDRPANPEAVITICKAEMLDEPEAVSAIDALAELLNKGDVTADKLLELAKGAKPEPVAEPLAKGMWSVQDFAGILCSLGWICRDAQDEAGYEGDDSPVPAQLRAWLADGIKIFQAMAAEETAELLAGLKTAAGEVDVIEMAQRGGDLAKAGAKFSKDAKDKLSKAHAAVKAAADHLASTGYDAAGDEDDDEAGKAAGADDLAKVAGELDLAKADLLKMSAEKDALQKRVKELEALPAPGKALLKAISKGEDVGGAATKAPAIPEVKKGDGSLDEAASLIKFIHTHGGALAG